MILLMLGFGARFMWNFCCPIFSVNTVNSGAAWTSGTKNKTLLKKKKAGFDSVTACKKLITTLLVWLLLFFFLEGICFLFLPRGAKSSQIPDQNLRCLQFFGSLLMLLPYRRTYLRKPLLMQVLWLWTESKEVFAQVVRNHRDEDFQEVADNILNTFFFPTSSCSIT